MMKRIDECELLGRWRITEADLWEEGYIDLCGPAVLVIGADGHGDIAFGALQAGLDLEYARTSVFFEWQGFDEMDEVRGSGAAELQDDGSLEIEFSFHNGDEAVLKAVRASPDSGNHRDHQSSAFTVCVTQAAAVPHSPTSRAPIVRSR